MICNNCTKQDHANCEYGSSCYCQHLPAGFGIPQKPATDAK